MYKISISGKANTGKNTLGKVLTKKLRKAQSQKLTVKYMAFADPIKKMILKMLPDLPYEFLFGPSELRNEIIPGSFKDGKPLTVRQLLLDLGTGARNYNPYVWIENFDHRLRNNSSKDIVVVTDVRFRDEFEYLKQNGFYQIRLYRNNGVSINHESETNQKSIADDEFDYVIHNDKSIKDLKNEVKNNIISLLVNR